MNKSYKAVIWIVVIFVVVAGLWWYFSQPKTSPTQVQNQGSTSGLTTGPADASNAALNQDLSTVDSQLNSLSADSASIDQGLNDQPIQQGQ